MEGKYKSFDPELFEQNDNRARNAVMETLNHDGMYVHINDDHYGPDLMVYVGFKHKYYVECEVKHNWKDGTRKFPFPTVQLPERKAKFAKLTKSVEFWILSEDLLSAVIIPDYILDSIIPVEVPNRLVASGELFYQVPIDQCIIRRL